MSKPPQNKNNTQRRPLIPKCTFLSQELIYWQGIPFGFCYNKANEGPRICPTNSCCPPPVGFAFKAAISSKDDVELPVYCAYYKKPRPENDRELVEV